MNKIDVLAIGDPHSKRSNQAELELCAAKIYDHIRQRSPKMVFILGDLGNDHEKVYLVALNGMVNFLKYINAAAYSVGAQVYYIVGNHDAENNQIFLEESHVMNAFKMWPNVTIVDTPIALRTDAGLITMCPYVPPGRLTEALDTLQADNQGNPVDWRNSEVIFCHQEFWGAALGALPSKHGDKWRREWPTVISGHIHTASTPQPNVIYIGAPMYHTFADEGKKGIAMVSLGADGVQTELIDLGMPEKLTFRLTVADAMQFVVPDNASVRLMLSGTTQEYAKFKKTKKYAELSMATKIIPHITDPVQLQSNVIKRQSYLEILAESCQNENQSVKKALDEVTK